MEKISCNVIKDLLPIYCDDICSEDSRQLVESHLRDCPDCTELLAKMKQEYRLAGKDEPEQEEMVKKMASTWHKSVKMSFCKGVLLTVCVCLFLAGGYLALSRLIQIPVPLDMAQAVVKSVSGDHVEIYFQVMDGKKVQSTFLEITEDGRCFITLKRGVISQRNGNHENWDAEWSVSRTGFTKSGKEVTVREIYCGTEGEHFLIWEAE